MEESVKLFSVQDRLDITIIITSRTGCNDGKVSKIFKNVKAENGEVVMKANPFFQSLCFSFTIAIIIVGCASTSSTGVFPSGKDTYTVVVSGSRFYEPVGPLQKMAYQEANDFCSSRGKKLQPVATKAVPGGRRTPPSFELRFRALSPDDPEYSRPDLEPVPDVKVDVKGQ